MVKLVSSLPMFSRASRVSSASPKKAAPAAAQEKKVQSLEKALNAAKSEYGENSDEALELEKSLNECKAEMKSTGTQVKKTSDALKNSSGSWAKFQEPRTIPYKYSLRPLLNVPLW